MANYTLGTVAIANKGAYSASLAYEPLNAVTNAGGCFLCKAACSGIEPGVTAGWAAYWTAIANGIQSIALSSPSEGTAQCTVVMTDGTSQSFSFSTTAIADGSITREKLADGVVDNTKTDFSQSGFAPNGIIILTEGLHYGATAPSNPVNGQFFLLEVEQ